MRRLLRRIIANGNFQQIVISLIGLLTVATSSAQDLAPIKLELELPSKANFLDVAGSYHVDADLGSIPSGSKVDVKLVLRNTEAHDIPVASASASCGCTHAELMSDKIPAQGSALLEVKLKTAAESSSPEFRGSITLKVDKSRSEHRDLDRVVVNMRYVFSDLFCFRDNVLPITVSKSSAGMIRVPFICTTGVGSQDVEVEVSGCLEGAKGKVHLDGVQQFVELEIRPDMGSSIGEHGTLTLIDPSRNQSAAVTILLRKISPITLSPRTLRFREKENGDYLASGVVRIRDEGPTPIKGTSTTKERDQQKMFGEAHIAGRPLRFEIKRIGQSVGRFELIAKSSVFEPDAGREPMVTWKVIAGEVQSVGKSSFSIANDR